MSKAQAFDAGQCEGKNVYDGDFLKVKKKKRKEKLRASGNENHADISKNKIQLTSGLHKLSPWANKAMIKSMGERAMKCGYFLQMKSRAGLCVC